MSRDLGDFGDTIGSALGAVARRATDPVSQNGHGRAAHGGDGALSGMRGVVAGAVVAAAAPLAAKEAGKALRNAVTKRAGEPVEGAKGVVGDVVERKIDQAGGVPGAMKEAGKQMLSGGGGGKSKGTPGVGKGRRMPVQQAVDVAVPLEVAYNQWTQFEEWPQFMHRVMQVTQEDDCSVSFKVKVWGMSKEFVAQIVEQRPDERIQWSAGDGVTHTGVVTFHELGPRLTRVQVSLDVEPGSLIEKAARGMRHVKRAVRADLARFKAFIELQEIETGAWRGTIHDGEVVEQHERGYDRGRDYAEVDDVHDSGSSHTPRRPASAGARSASARRRPSSGGRARSRSDSQHARRPSGRRTRRRRAGASGGR